MTYDELNAIEARFKSEFWSDDEIDRDVGALIAEVRRLQQLRIQERGEAFMEGTLVMGDRIREEVLPPFRELVEWADNWLPDEAKDQGARDVLKRCKEKLHG